MSANINFMNHSLEGALDHAHELMSENPTLNFDPITQFLEALAKMAEPEAPINSDAEGYVVDGAYQNGFEFIDDDAKLLVAHQNDLIKYVMKNRGAHWLSTKYRQPEPGLIVKGWNGSKVLVAANHAADEKTSCDWFIHLPPLPEPGK